MLSTQNPVSHRQWVEWHRLNHCTGHDATGRRRSDGALPCGYDPTACTGARFSWRRHSEHDALRVSYSVFKSTELCYRGPRDTSPAWPRLFTRCGVIVPFDRERADQPSSCWALGRLGIPAPINGLCHCVGLSVCRHGVIALGTGIVWRKMDECGLGLGHGTRDPRQFFYRGTRCYRGQPLYGTVHGQRPRLCPDTTSPLCTDGICRAGNWYGGAHGCAQRQ